MQKLPELENSKKSLRFAILQTLGITFVILVGIILASNWWVNSTVNSEKKEIESNLTQIMTLARRSIEPEIAAYRIGISSRDEAINNIVKTLRNMTFTDKYGENYIFLVTYDGIIQVQPYQPLLEGTNQWDMQDINGKYLIREILKVARASETGGFVSYFYKPPNLDMEEEKISYVIDIPELEVVIGTGMYMRLYYEDQTSSIRRLMLGTLLIGCLVLLMTLNALRRIRNTGRELEEEIIARENIQDHLEKSESNLRTVFNSISDAFFIHTEEGEILEVNDRVLSMYGCTRNEIIGQLVFILANPDKGNKERLLQIFKKALQGETFVFELHAQRLDTKEPFYIESAIQRGTWHGKDVIVAVVRDIQNRKIIERELIRSQLINEHAEEMGQIGHYTIDNKTGEITWSKGEYKLFKRDTSLSPPDFDEYYTIIVPEDVERVKFLRLEMQKKNQPYSVDYKIRRGDGEIRDVTVKVDWLAEGDDPHRYLIGSIQDVTERNRNTEELRRREELFRTTLQQMTDGLLLLDEDTRIIEWNSSSTEITGIDRKFVVGQLFCDVLKQLGLDETNHTYLRDLEEELGRVKETRLCKYFDDPVEVLIKTVTGQSRALLQTIFPIESPNSFRMGVVLHDVTEQKAAMEKINHELKKLSSLRSIDAAILERISPTKTLELICSIAVDLLDVDGAIILTRMARDEMTSAYVSRIDTPEDPLISHAHELQVRSLEKFNTRILTVNDLEKIDAIQQMDPESGGLLNQSILPLLLNKKICGYIQVYSRKPIPEDQEWVDYFHTLAGQTSLAVESVTLITNEEIAYDELNHAYESTIAGWSKALELRDEETKGHSDRVMDLACRLARKVNFPEENITAFRRGVLLHDIGKMGIPDRILLKPGPLSDEEWAIMKQHPSFAFDLLSSIPYLTDSLEIPYLHHERWNGSGYPKGLKGKDIPLSARIFAIVDVWDALISDRPYRKGWPVENIRQYLIDNKHVLFDPELIDMFLELLDEPESDLQNH